MRRHLLALAAVIALVVAGGPPVHALVVSGFTVTGDETEELIRVSCVGGNLTAEGLSGDPCATTTFVAVHPGGRSDTVDLSGLAVADFPALVSTIVRAEEVGSEVTGFDTVVGSPVSDNLLGDPYDVLRGNDGNDRLRGGAVADGGAGDDTIADVESDATANGGPGDDRFVEVTGLGGVDGGPGADSFEIDYGQQVAALGAGLGLRLGADVLELTTGASSYSSPVRDIESVDITLLTTEEQAWDGAAFAGPQRVRGLGGIDTLTGGVADDALYGGGGNDAITGNAGADVLHGGDGDDSIQARDGVADRIDCGAGTDAVVADAVDVVANCESVDLPPVVTPPVVTPPVVTPPVVVPETGAISGPARVTKPTVAKFKFSSPTAGATFQCKVDGKAWKTCASPYKVATKKLTPGKHKLQVRAVVGGKVDATPSKKVFRVRRG